MAEPEHYSEGTEQRRLDTRLRVWSKILGHYQNIAGAIAANNPRREDTRRVIKQKTLNAIRGSTYTG